MNEFDEFSPLVLTLFTPSVVPSVGVRCGNYEMSLNEGNNGGRSRNGEFLFLHYFSGQKPPSSNSGGRDEGGGFKKEVS